MKLRLLVLVLLVNLFALSAPAVTHAAEPTWAPAGTASIRPGAATLTGDALCTANFVFYDGAGDVYLGQAAHCSSNADSTSLNGCINRSAPLGSRVLVAGATRPGVMVYNSWLAMQERQETDDFACRYNDFALVKLDPADRPGVNPSLQFWGGPAGTVPTSFAGSPVFGTGSDIVQGAVSPHPKRGVVLRQAGGGWLHVVDLDRPGVPGDSGSALVDGQGRAFGVMSTFSPRSGLNGVGDLSRMLDYMGASGFAGITLAHGTDGFNPGPPPPPPDPIGDLLRGLLGGLLGQPAG